MTGHIRRRCNCPQRAGRKQCAATCKARYAVVIYEGRDPVTQKPRHRWRGGFRTKKEAERVLAELLVARARGTYVTPSAISLRAFLQEQWLPTIQPTIRRSTFESYSRNVRLHVVPRIGSIPVQQLTAADLNRVYRVLGLPKAASGAGLSARTVQYVHTIIHHALRDAAKLDIIARNVAELASPPRVARPADRKTWTGEELKRFLAFVEGDRLFGAYWLLSMTGVRRGELLGLRWGDIRLDNGHVAITRTLVTVDVRHDGSTGAAWSTPKTTKGKRSIALDPATIETLRRYARHQAAELARLGLDQSADSLVVAEPDGSLIHPKTFSYRFSRLVRDAGVPTISVHGVRHTHATLALELGIHPKIVQERLGHSTIAVTLDTYSHVSMDLQAQAAQALSQALGVMGTAGGAEGDRGGRSGD